MKKNTLKNLKVAILASFLAFLALLPTKGLLASGIIRENVIELMNQARKTKGLEELQINDKLSRAASDKAEDMISNNYFAHNSPNGITPWFWFEKNKYDYTYAGENLAMDFQTAEKQQQSWMESESHRKNILNPNYQEVGIAVKQGMINGHLTIVTVQEFGARTDFVMSPQPANKLLSDLAPEKVLGSQQNKIILPENVNLTPNASPARNLDTSMLAVSAQAAKSFQYAKDSFKNPSRLETMSLGIYSALLVIVLVINPLIMLYLMVLLLARKLVKVKIEVIESSSPVN